MSPEDALNILDQAASMLQLNRADHFKIQTAVQVLKTVINPKKEESSPKKS